MRILTAIGKRYFMTMLKQTSIAQLVLLISSRFQVSRASPKTLSSHGLAFDAKGDKRSIAERSHGVERHYMSTRRRLQLEPSNEIWRETEFKARKRRLEQPNWVQLGSDIDGESAGDFSGNSIALAVDNEAYAIRVAIGAPFNDGDATQPGIQVHNGHVRVYEYDNLPSSSSIESSSVEDFSSSNAWAQVGQDLDGEEAVDSFGSIVVLSGNGTRVAACAPLNYDQYKQITGHVQVLEEDPSTGEWKTVGEPIHGVEHMELFGAGMALSADGTRLAVGAPLYSAKATKAGQVRVFEESGGAWTQIGGSIDGEGEEDESGGALAMSGNGERIAIGAKFNDGGGYYSGHVRVYEFSHKEATGEKSWIQLGSDIDGHAAKDHSGEAVALSADGRILAVGSSRSDEMKGSVQVFEEINRGWLPRGHVIHGEHSGGMFGFSLDLSEDGQFLSVGAPKATNDNGDALGCVKVFKFDNIISDWTPLGNDLWGEAANDLFGGVVSLAVSSSNIAALAVAAPGNDENGYYSGHVRAFAFDLNSILEMPPPTVPQNHIDEATLVALPVDVCQCDMKTNACKPHPLRPQDDLVLCFSTKATHLQFNMIYSMVLKQDAKNEDFSAPLYMEVIRNGGLVANKHTMTSVKDAGASTLVQTRPMTAFFVSSVAPSKLEVSGIVQMALRDERKNEGMAHNPLGRENEIKDGTPVDPSVFPATSFSLEIELRQHDAREGGFPTFQAVTIESPKVSSTSPGSYCAPSEIITLFSVSVSVMLIAAASFC